MFQYFIFLLLFSFSVEFFKPPQFPPFRIVKYPPENGYNPNGRTLFRRVKDSSCPYYVQQDAEDVVMYFVRGWNNLFLGIWTVGNKYTIEHKHSSCPKVKFMKQTTWAVEIDLDFFPCDGTSFPYSMVLMPFF